MAGFSRSSVNEVMAFSLKPNQNLSQFSIPEDFKHRCVQYLRNSQPYVNTGSSQPRFLILNYDGLIIYNYYKMKDEEDFNNCVDFASIEDIPNWQTAIKCLQRYCINLLLAPRRQEFHHIKFSTGYYQYNIANNFKGGEKVLEAMGYKPDAKLYTKICLGKGKDPTNHNNRVTLAKVLVDLVLFDIELGILTDCMREYAQYAKKRHGEQCSIVDALNARKSTSGGVDYAVRYLIDHPPAVSKVSSTPKSKGPLLPSTGPANGNPIAVREPSSFAKVDPSTLPPPQFDDSNEFGSFVKHTDASSHIDDDVELIRDSTQLGYRNPPEVRPQVLPRELPSVANQAAYYLTEPGSRSKPPLVASYDKPPPVVREDVRYGVADRGAILSGPPTSVAQSQHTSAGYNIPPIRGPVMESAVSNPPFADPFGYSPVTATTSSTGLPSTTVAHEYGESQYTNAGRSRGNFQYGGTRSSNLNSEPPLSLPSTGTLTGTNADQSGINTRASHLGRPHLYARQRSHPSDIPSFDDSEKLTTVTGPAATAASNISTAITPVVNAVETPFDSKFGRTNLAQLKNQLDQKREVTKTVQVVQAGGTTFSTPQSTSAHGQDNTGGMPQSSGATNNWSSSTDLKSLRSKLDKTKEQREKTVVQQEKTKDAAGTNKSDYYNFNEFSSQRTGNPVIIENPPYKKPMAPPRSKDNPVHIKPGNADLTPLRINFQLWRCAHCETVNKSADKTCSHCKLVFGRMSNRSVSCNFCQMLILIPIREDRTNIYCPRCKVICESIL